LFFVAYSLSFSVYADEPGKEIWDLCKLSKALIYASAVADLKA
jgi:hypothetical protein